MTRTIKAKFDGRVLVPTDIVGLTTGQEVDVRVRDHEPPRSTAAASRRLADELLALPTPDAETMDEDRLALMSGHQPRAEISPFGDFVDDPELMKELNEPKSAIAKTFENAIAARHGHS